VRYFLGRSYQVNNAVYKT